MNIKKIETNYKRDMHIVEKNIKPSRYKDSIEKNVINIYPNIQYQRFIGFGGAITQAVGIAYKKLPQEKQRDFLEEYFLKSNYKILRLPIGSCDFSQEKYSYSHTKNLEDFTIDKDKEYIIPVIKDIQKIKPDMKFLASPWSPPSFMKTNKMLTLGGKLLEKYYETYAKYLVKYIEEYRKIDINIDYITIQNEPNAIQIWESCLFTAEEELKFIKYYLYPEFNKNNLDTKILIYDHNKEKMYKRAKDILKSCDKEIEGIAYHWYTGDHFENIDICSKEFNDKILIHTEGCTGYSKFNKLDGIKNAEIYAHDIIGDLNHGSNGYIDWNILLDYNGGPNHKKNYCDSPIMLNKEGDDYYKNLSYYYINQISTAIKPGSKRIAISRYSEKIEVTAFKNIDNTIGIVLLNNNDDNYVYNLVLDDISLHDNLDSHSIVSYIIEL